MDRIAGKGFDGKIHKFSSTQVQLPADMAARLVEAGMTIPDEDLYNDPEDPTYGREDDAHITVQFGLHTADVADVAEVVRGFGPVMAELTRVSMFENDDTPYDVLKFDVSSPDLHRLHKLLNGSLEVTDTHPKYKPHATIAYVIKGAGKKYVHGTEWADKAEAALAGQEMQFTTMMFSGKDRMKTPIKLSASWLATAASPFPEPEWSPLYEAVDRALETAQAQAGKMENFLFEAGRILRSLGDDLIEAREDDAAVRQVTQKAIDAIRALSPSLEPLIKPLVDAIAGADGQIEVSQSAWLGTPVTAARAPGKVLIGVSGFNYKSWTGNFYPKGLPGKQKLTYLASQFPTVEMSSTFHQMPEPRVLQGWDAKTPDNFVMAFRGPKEVSHVRKLAACADIMADFCRRLEILGDKVGPIGFQMPESARFDPVALKAFLEGLPSGFRYALEFRSEPWYTSQTYDLLNKHDVALVTVSHSNMGIHPVYPASWSCFRMSGHDPDYSKNLYSRADLMNWRGIIAEAPEPAYVYFNNEYAAYSARNATELIDLMGLRAESSSTTGVSDPLTVTGPTNSQSPTATDADRETDTGYRAKERGDEGEFNNPDADNVFAPRPPKTKLV